MGLVPLYGREGCYSMLYMHCWRKGHVAYGEKAAAYKLGESPHQTAICLQLALACPASELRGAVA